MPSITFCCDRWSCCWQFRSNTIIIRACGGSPDAPPYADPIAAVALSPSQPKRSTTQIYFIANGLFPYRRFLPSSTSPERLRDADTHQKDYFLAYRVSLPSVYLISASASLPVSRVTSHIDCFFNAAPQRRASLTL